METPTTQSLRLDLKNVENITLTEIKGKEHLSHPFEYRLTFLSQNTALTLSDYVGKTATAHVDYHEQTNVYHGYLHELRAGAHTSDGLRTYHAVLTPWFSLLKNTLQCRIYQNKTTLDIIQDVLKRSNFSNYDLSHLTKKYVPHAYCVQYQETDFNFVSRLLEAAGIFYTFVHSDQKHIMIFFDSGFSTLEYPMPLSYSSSSHLEPCVQQWQQHNAFNKTSSPYAKGQSGYPALGAGLVFALEGHENGSANRRYLITSFEFHATEPLYSNQFTCINAQEAYAPEKRTPKPQMPSMHTARVVGVKDQDIYTDVTARVKVQFYWDQQGQSNENSSCWIPTSQWWAGETYGVQMIPRIGQEVLISFQQGNVDHPMIMGTLTTQNTPPPFTPEKAPYVSAIKTHSIGSENPEDANLLCFDDEKNELTLHAQKDSLYRVKGDSHITIQGSSSSIVENGNHTLLVDGILIIEATEAIEFGSETSELKITPSGIYFQGDQVMIQKGAASAPTQIDKAIEDTTAASTPNFYPKLSVDVETKPLALQDYIDGDYIVQTEATVSAQLEMINTKSVNPLSVDKDGLNAEAQTSADNLFSQLTVKNLTGDLTKNATLTLGLKEQSYSVSLSFYQFQGENMIFTGQLTKDIQKLNQDDWQISGNASFNVTMTAHKNNSNIGDTENVWADIKNYVSTHAVQITSAVVQQAFKAISSGASTVTSIESEGAILASYTETAIEFVGIAALAVA